MSILARLWTLPHPYPRPWVWAWCVAFLTLFCFLRWQAWFTAVLHARLLAELALCYRELRVIEADHRRTRRARNWAHRDTCPRCRSLEACSAA